jgi:branched-chain amino acid transport system permease protein
LNSTIALFLVQDGVINGAIYALVGIALVLVFSVTRVIFVPQGQFIAFAAFSIEALEQGRFPQTASLLVVLGALTVCVTTIFHWRSLTLVRWGWILLFYLIVPLILVALALWLAPTKLSPAAAIALTLLLIVPMGPMLYRIAFEPLQHASVLVLLIAALGLYFSLQGLALVFYGPEGISTTPLLTGSFQAGELLITGQSIAVIGTSVASIAIFGFVFERTLIGKALRACSSNRVGARLVGIAPVVTGQLAFALAAALGTVSGVLIAPIITVYYDSGFMIGLKAFVAVIMGGLLSYPGAVVASIAVGLAEAFFSFWASNFKEVLVFTLLIPFLFWRSFRAPHAEEEE